MSGIYDAYEGVKSTAGEFRVRLTELYNALDTNKPVLYVCTTDKKQIWFIEAENVSLNNDSAGAYSISLLGKGVRAYFASPVDPTIFITNDSLNGYQRPTPQDLIHLRDDLKLTRYEVFGTINEGNLNPQRISISDLIRNNTVGDEDDYLIGEIPNKHFVGNFAKAAAIIVGSGMQPEY